MYHIVWSVSFCKFRLLGGILIDFVRVKFVFCNGPVVSPRRNIIVLCSSSSGYRTKQAITTRPRRCFFAIFANQ